MYLEKRYCFDCCFTHWLEVTRHDTQICHGENLLPTSPPPDMYCKHSGRGFTWTQKASSPFTAIEYEPTANAEA